MTEEKRESWKNLSQRSLETLSIVNRHLELQSILYDLDLLPEQLEPETMDWARMGVIVILYKHLKVFQDVTNSIKTTTTEEQEVG